MIIISVSRVDSSRQRSNVTGLLLELAHYRKQSQIQRFDEDDNDDNDGDCKMMMMVGIVKKLLKLSLRFLSAGCS